jgi:hypothetical protein
MGLYPDNSSSCRAIVPVAVVSPYTSTEMGLTKMLGKAVVAKWPRASVDHKVKMHVEMAMPSVAASRMLTVSALGESSTDYGTRSNKSACTRRHSTKAPLLFLSIGG